MDVTTVDLARAYGLDISLLRSRMQCTPEERLSLACGNASDIAHLRRRPANYAALLSRLVESGACFVMVGSMAAAAHGSAYIPNDLDICLDATAECAGKLAAALRPIHPRHEDSPDIGRTVDSIAAGSRLELRTDEGDLVLLGWIDGIGDYRECLAASELIPWGDRSVRALVPEALILALRDRFDPQMLGPLLALEAIVRLNIEGPAPRGCNLRIL
jgi:hypothetical protein